MKGNDFIKQFAQQAPFAQMHPQIAGFFFDYLAHEKIKPFQNKYVLNTHFPPFPSKAFQTMVKQFNQIGEVTTRTLFSVTLGVTNRCTYSCWHCYNAERKEHDLPLLRFQKIARELQNLGTVVVTLSGGEPLLRDDLEEIVRSFDERTSLNLNTTGNGLNHKRASALRKAGLFAVGISLDSLFEEIHDRLRGKKGAFQTAVQALQIAAQNELYPYLIAVATREFLEPDHFWPYLSFAAQLGAAEVHLLEPSATGRLAGNKDVLLRKSERQRILDYQTELSQNDDLPILSTLTYLESADSFGCGAGLTHLYIDGSGEVCPCNLVPLSFGNVTTESLRTILDRMGHHFCKPRPHCLGQILAKHITTQNLPLAPSASLELCRRILPKKHPLPRFFQIRTEAKSDVGQVELKAAYNKIHGHYDQFWLTKAAEPIDELIEKLCLQGHEQICEAGCGTGYATALLAQRLAPPRQLLAVDLSQGMLSEAVKRTRNQGYEDILFHAGDALELVKKQSELDLIFSSWVLGYIALEPFFKAAKNALSPDGRIAFVVHIQNSPVAQLRIFQELVAQDPSALIQKVAFDFPIDLNHLDKIFKALGLRVEYRKQDQITFSYPSPEAVLEHLLKSGAGTAYYDAIQPQKKNFLKQQFLQKQAELHQEESSPYLVIHDYISCIVRKK